MAEGLGWFFGERVSGASGVLCLVACGDEIVRDWRDFVFNISLGVTIVAGWFDCGVRVGFLRFFLVFRGFFDFLEAGLWEASAMLVSGLMVLVCEVGCLGKGTLEEFFGAGSCGFWRTDRWAFGWWWVWGLGARLCGFLGSLEGKVTMRAR